MATNETTASLELRLLGPLEAVRDGRTLELGGAQQRALLAVLLLHRGAVVSADVLIDQLWDRRPPPTAAKTVHVYVSRVRKVLGDGVLLTRGHGYLLAVEPAQVDAERFESLADAGNEALHEGDPRTAAERLREALSLWRGPALADFTYAPFAESHIARLEERRLAALEDRIEAELELGRHAALVGELEELVREHPLRERLLAQLMLALYRSGRQADALATYRRARETMIDELGLEPGSRLRQLELAMLAQDRELEPPASRPARVPVARRGGRLLALGGAVLVGAVIAATLELTTAGAGGMRVPANSVAAVDVRTDRVVGAVPVGSAPGALAFGSGSLWVANVEDQTISRVDPAALRSLRTIPVAGPPTGMAASAGGVWVAESNPENASRRVVGSLLVGRLDPAFDAVRGVTRLPAVVASAPGAMTSQGGSLWVAPSTGLLTRVDATTGRVLSRLDPNASPSGMAAGEGAVWITDAEAGDVVRVDPTGLLTPIPVGQGPSGIAAGAGAVWVADSLDDRVVRIDPQTRSVTATIPVGLGPAGVTVGDGSVWVADSGDGTITRIDPGTGRVQATIAVGGSPQAIAIARGRAWVTVDAQSIRPGGRSGGGTLRMVSAADVDYMDPALAYASGSVQLLAATCAKLLNYPDRPGPAGSQLTPELAQSLPQRSPDGRTYRFRIRPGFRFSPPSGRPVTALAIKDTIERTLNPAMRSPWATYLAGVVGARAYMAGRARHISGVVANGSVLTIRLVAPVPDLPSRIASPGFCVVPPDTPVDPNGVRVIPSAGPYHVTSYVPGQGVVLVRNPDYHGRRPHRFARIQFAVGVADGRAVSEIERGAADYAVLGLGSQPSSALAGLVARVAARFGPGSPAARRGRQRYFVNPLLETDFFFLNDHRPLFRDPRLRRAVNEAIDRRALAALGSGFEPLPERPADHYLPPGMPGFRAADVYPLTPDRALARRLVAQAHASGRTAVLYTLDTPPGPEQAQIVKSDLATIGLEVEVRTLPSATLFARLTTPGEPFDLGYLGWAADYPDPSQMLNHLLEDRAIGPTLADPSSARRLERAARLAGPERYLTYGALDVELARRAAPLAAFGNAASHDFFSARIGCQTFGVYGMDLGALCRRDATP